MPTTVEALPGHPRCPAEGASLNSIKPKPSSTANKIFRLFNVSMNQRLDLDCLSSSTLTGTFHLHVFFTSLCILRHSARLFAEYIADKENPGLNVLWLIYATDGAQKELHDLLMVMIL